MDNTRINRRAADAGEHQAAARGNRSRQRKYHQHQSDQQDRLSYANHRGVVEPHGQESTDTTAGSNPEVEQTRPARGDDLVDPVIHHQIAARPQPGGQLDGAIAEEHEKNRLRATDSQDPADAKRLSRCDGVGIIRSGRRIVPHVVSPVLPQRQAEHDNCGQHDLDNGDIPVPPMPALTAG